MTGWLLHWLAVHTGTVNEPGPYYGFFSGFGSDLQEFGVFALLFGAYHRHNCHTPRCWRIGRYHVAGGEFTVCGRCYPGGPPQARHILAAHQAHVRRQNPPASTEVRHR